MPTLKVFGFPVKTYFCLQKYINYFDSILIIAKINHHYAKSLHKRQNLQKI